MIAAPPPPSAGEGPAGILGALLTIRHRLTRLLERVVMIAVALLTIDVLWGVVTRYFLGEQSRWTEELARVLLIWVALLGTSVAFSVKGHLGVDFFVGLFAPGAHRLMRAVAHLVVIGFTLSAMVWGGFRLVMETFQLEQMMMALNVPKGWVYLAVPISGLFITLFEVESLAETIMNAEPQEGC